MKIHIENVPSDATEQEIRHLFSGYGKVRLVQLMPDPVHPKPSGTALVDLEESHIMDIRALPDRYLFKGTVIRIRFEPYATNNPSADHSSTPLDPSLAASPLPDNRSKYVFRIVSVENVIDPHTGEPNGWCRYSIESLTGSISGLRRGTVREVRLYAEEATEAFNLRNRLGHPVSPAWPNHHKK